jgi:CreA protein
VLDWSRKPVTATEISTGLKTMPLRLIALSLVLCSLFAAADEIGSVDTKWRALSPDDSINLDVFDDDKVSGVACYLSRAQIGGYRGAMGIAEDTSDASLNCQQVGPITILEPFKKGELVFRERRSLIFKSMKVLRYCDTERNVIVYLVYSEKVIEGSPKNSVSAIPIAHWGGADTSQPLAQCTYKP